jgi:hypothetical protein
VEWRDGAYVERPGFSGRDLVWFPDPTAGADCYRAGLADPLLLVDAFPQLRRASARLAASRVDRVTVALPMLVGPPVEGAPGAIPSGPGKGNLIVDGFVDAGSFDLFANNLSGSGEIWYQESLIVSGDVTGSLHVRSVVLEPTAVYRPQVVFPAPGDPPTTNVLTTYYSAGLGGARLEVSIEGSAAVGQSVTILVNHADIPVNGTFSELPEGAVFLAGNGQTFRISYSGGDGNDVVITRVLVPLEVSGITAYPRPFDGTTNAVLDIGQAYLVGLLPADASTILVTQGDGIQHGHRAA